MELATKVRRVSKEIDQVGVAVSVVGTRRAKLLQLANLAQDVLNTLRGERREVKSAALNLRQRIHDVRVSRPDQSAAQQLIALKRALDAVLELVSDGIGVADEVIKAGDIPVGNAWGYTDQEAKPAIDAVKDLSRKLRALSIPTSGLTVVLDPEWGTDGAFSFYDKEWETVVMSPLASAGYPLRMLARDVGKALWDTLSSSDRDAWDGSREKFAQAFGAFVGGMPEQMSGDDWARLRVTIGRSATKWPEKV